MKGKKNEHAKDKFEDIEPNSGKNACKGIKGLNETIKISKCVGSICIIETDFGVAI